MTIDNQRVFAASEIGTLYHDDGRSIVEKYGSFCAPYFKLEISDKDDNQLFSADTLLNEGGFDLNGLIVGDVSYEEDIDGAASVMITVNDPDLRLINSQLFSIGNNIDVWMGYDGRTPFYMGRGIVVEPKPTLPASGMATIKITAYDISYFMMEEGKGEIVPEGSAWYERSQVRRTGQEPRLRPANTSHPDTMSDEERAERQADNNRIIIAAGTEGMIEDEDFLATSTATEEETTLGSDLSLEEIDRIDIPEDPRNMVLRAGRYAVGPSQIQTRTGWQLQNFARRQRQAGKVWRNLTDAEVVAKIFQSYGITPYVEATSERVRRFSGRNRPSTPIVPASLTNYDLDAQIDELSEDQIRRLELEVRDDESLEDARERLGDEVNSWQSYGSDSSGDMGVSPDLSPEGNEAFFRPMAGDPDLYPLSFRGEATGFEDTWGTYGSGNELYQHYIMIPSFPDNTPPQMSVRTGEGGDHSVTQKAGTTDWDFLKELAAKHGFIFFVFFHIESRRWIGYWGSESNVPQFRQYIFKYNAGDLTTLGDVTPNTSARGQATEIDLIYTDPASRRENRLRVSMDSVSNYSSEFRGETGTNSIAEPLGDGPDVILAVHGQRIHVRADHRFTSAEDARIWLMAYWIKHAEDFALLEGNTIVGIPELRAREHHQFEGLMQHSGTYFVTQSRHQMSPNSMYQTEFTARRSSILQPGDENSDALTVDQRDIGSNTADESETGLVL